MTVRTRHKGEKMAKKGAGGRKPQGPRDRIDLRVPPEWRERVERQAKRLGMDISAYIRMATTRQLEADEATDPSREEGGSE